MRLFRVRWWVQETQESGRWDVSGLTGLDNARDMVHSGYYENAEIVLDEPGWPLYTGSWARGETQEVSDE